MNAAEEARLHVQSLLARGLGIAGASERPDVIGASEIWGGAEPRDKPGWYLWLRDRPGAYALDLEEAEIEEWAETRALRTRLSIRHYPSPAEPGFAGHPAEERGIVLGGMLDATGAPDIARASSIPPALFVIGALELIIDERRATHACSLGAPDRLRDAPAWEVAVPLFTAMIGLVAQVERRPAARLVEAGDASYRTAVVVFDPGARCRRAVLLSLDPDAPVLRDVSLAEHRPSDADVCAARSVPIPVSWFPEGSSPPQRVACGC